MRLCFPTGGSSQRHGQNPSRCHIPPPFPGTSPLPFLLVFLSLPTCYFKRTLEHKNELALCWQNLAKPAHHCWFYILISHLLHLGRLRSCRAGCCTLLACATICCHGLRKSFLFSPKITSQEDWDASARWPVGGTFPWAPIHPSAALGFFLTLPIKLNPAKLYVDFVI